MSTNDQAEAVERGRNHGDAAYRYAQAYGGVESPKDEGARRAEELYPGNVNLVASYRIGFEEGWALATAECSETGAGHQHAILILRAAARDERTMRQPDNRKATRWEAAAALLETHDATGINLATFGPVGTFVNDVLEDFGYAEFTDNGV